MGHAGAHARTDGREHPERSRHGRPDREPHAARQVLVPSDGGARLRNDGGPDATGARRDPRPAGGRPAGRDGRLAGLFPRLGASSLDVEVFAYVRTETYPDFLAVQEELLLRILEIVEAAGASVAFPTQTVYLAEPGPGAARRGDRALEALPASTLAGPWRPLSPAERSPAPSRPLRAGGGGDRVRGAFGRGPHDAARPLVPAQDAPAGGGGGGRPGARTRSGSGSAPLGARDPGVALQRAQDGDHFPFHVTHEGWIGQNTYSGGGDKASHFVSYYIVGKLMNE